MSDPDCWIPRDAVVALFQLAAERTGDEFFGLRLGATVDPRNMGLLAYLVTNGPTLQVALNDLQTCIRLFCDGADMRLNVANRRASLICRLSPSGGTKERQFVEWFMALIVAGLRRMIGAEWSPSEVSFQHSRPDDISTYTRCLGPEVIFDRPATAVVIDPRHLNDRPRDADDRLYPILKAQAEAVLGSGSATDDLVKSLRAFVVRSLVKGYPAIEDAAREVGVSVRTLQRRLSALGTDYSRLVDDIRRDLAQQYLADESRSFKEIAHLLGYSQPSAFNRAWRRWTGSTPQEFRNRGTSE